MKNKSTLTPALRHPFRVLLATLMLLGTLHAPLSTFAQGPAFTYQGRLNSSGAPTSGSYDLIFTLHDSLTGGASVGSFVLLTAVPVTDGLFAATLNTSNEFGATAFDGTARWLEIGVRTNTTVLLNFTTLTPRQPLTATPYAIRALTASNLTGRLPVAQLLGTIPASQLPASVVTNNASGLSLTGALSGNGTGLSNVNASSLGAFAAADFWRLGGNPVAPGQFFGSTNNAALELRANSETVMRYAYRSNATHGVAPNVIGGYSGNTMTVNILGIPITAAGGTIGGGGYVGKPNLVLGDLGTVSGGANNVAEGLASTVVGGLGNTASDDYSTAMGWRTTASGFSSTAMGNTTTASGGSSTAMGDSTTASGGASTAMGSSTTASGLLSTAMGYRAKALHDGSFVWADLQPSDFSSTAVNQFSVRASGGVRLSDDTPALSFGSDARQMINLFDANYGIGVQTSTTYFRSNSRFSWFRDGTHSDTQNDPGAGGVVAMTLTSGGLTVNGVVVSSSDRNVKAGFRAVDPQAILARVAALPIQRWHFTNDVSTPHIGPMAQDFHAAFGVGTDDKHIATVDADGVVLAAIQGLNQKVEEQRSELKARDAEIQALQARVTELEQLKETVAQLLRPKPSNARH